MKFLAFIGRNRTLLEEIYYTFANFGELSDNFFYQVLMGISLYFREFL